MFQKKLMKSYLYLDVPGEKLFFKKWVKGVWSRIKEKKKNHVGCNLFCVPFLPALVLKCPQGFEGKCLSLQFVSNGAVLHALR